MSSGLTSPLRSLGPLSAAFDIQSNALLRLSTASRINRAADNPSGLIVSSSIRAVLRVLDAQTRGLERADAYASTADAALGEVSSMLDDAGALAVRAANAGGLPDAERDAIQTELDSIVQGVNHVGQSTTFASIQVFDGDAVISTGEDSISLDRLAADALAGVEIDGQSYTLADVASGGSADLSTDPELARQIIDEAGEDVAARRAGLGAYQARSIAPRLSTNTTAVRELSSALSIIADTNNAVEIASLTRGSILAAGSVATLALASAITRGVLPLLSP